MRLCAKINLIFFILASIIYLIYCYKSASNSPYIDDYKAIIEFSTNYQKTNNFTDKISLVIDQINEHRVIITKSIVAFSIQVFGYVNIKGLIFAGNLFLVIFSYLLIRYYLNQSLISLIITIPLLYNPQHHENFQWALAATQNYGVLLFSAVSILLSIKKIAPGSIIMGMLAFFCSSNGVIVLLIISYVFYVQQKKMLAFLSLVVTVLLGFGFYWLLYEPVSHHPSITLLVEKPIIFIQHFLVLNAAFLERNITTNGTILQISGAFMFLLSFILFRKRFAKNKIDLQVLIGIFIILSMLMISIGRVGFGWEQAYSSRYKILSAILFSMIIYNLILAIRDYKQWIYKIIQSVILVLPVIHLVTGILIIGTEVMDKKRYLDLGICRYLIKDNSLLVYKNRQEAEEILNKAILQGAYKTDITNCN